MGLELHLNDLLKADEVPVEYFNTNNKKHEWVQQCCEHVNEIVDACNDTQNTLNDLLTYDNIENGMLVMDRKAVGVLSFFTSEFRTFAIQVSEFIGTP